MDSPPSNRGNPANALPDGLLEFIDEATLLLEERQPSRAPSQPADSTGPTVSVKSVVLENISVAPQPAKSRPSPQTPAPPAAIREAESARPHVEPAPPQPQAPPLETEHATAHLAHETPAVLPLQEPSRDLTVADLTVARIDRSWQEAVAVWLELLDGWPDNTGCPRPDATIVSTSGTVRALPTVVLDGHPVACAATLLSDLLPATRVPAELRDLLDRAMADHPAHASIQELVRAVSYFGRPNRRTDVSAFCQRGLEFYRSVEVDRELDRLRTRVTEDFDRRLLGLRALLERLRPQSAQPTITLGLWALIFINSAALVWFAVTPAPSRPLPPSDRPLAALPPPPPSSDVGGFVGPVSSPSVPAVESRTSPHQDSTRRVSLPRLIVKEPSEAALPQMAAVVSVASTTPEWNVFVREVLPEIPAGTSSYDDLNAVYSEANGDVTPPSLVRPQVPIADDPPAPDSAVSEFELIIDRSGRVERVRLLSPGNLLRDKMLLAAAKAWQFQPALRNGQPVRYRFQLRVRR